MAFKRPLPAGFDQEWNELRERSARLRRELTDLLEDCDRLLHRARTASLTHKEAVAEYLEQRSDRVFGSRQIQRALEAEGLAFSNYYTVSAMLTRLQGDGRAVQVSHGKWTARSKQGSLAHSGSNEDDGHMGAERPS